MYEAGPGNWVVYIISGIIIVYLFYSFFRARKSLNRPPSEHVKILTDKNFDTVVSKGVSLVDFWAEWCGPCKMQGPIVDEVADELNGKANICKLNVDENKRTAGKFGIQSIPTMLVFHDGKPVNKLVGLKSKGAILKALQPYL
ncbi:MAG: thioredoxin [Bacteroidales bacterium]|nr:thioredoxin [Bacteroidales bacterium]